VSHPRILGIGTANPPFRLTQAQSFHAAGYERERIRKIFLNSDIDYRHFYLEGALNRKAKLRSTEPALSARRHENRLLGDSGPCEFISNYCAGCGVPGSLHLHRLCLSGCGQSAHRTYGVQ
jgi:hypothetical protein